MASPKALLMLLSVFVIMFSGVRWQVLRKKRTSFADRTHLEDSEFGNSTRFRVIAGAETTGGEYFVVEALVRPGAYGVWRGSGPAGGGGLSSPSSAPAPQQQQRPGSEPPHSHAFQTEVVIVKSGMLGFWKGPRGDEDLGDEQQQQGRPVRARPSSAPGRGRTGVVGPGDAIVFAEGEPHAWWNAGVVDPNAPPPTKEADAQATKDKDGKKKKKQKRQGKGGGEGEDSEEPPAVPPVAASADPGELLVQVVTWPAGPAGERLYENLAGLGRDYGSPLAVGPPQRALTYARAAARLETVTAEAWASTEGWLLPLLESLGYKGLYPRYRSDVARATDLDAAAQAYAEARAAHESGGAGADDNGEEGGKKNKVRGTGLKAELIGATVKSKEARRAKLSEIARKRRQAQQEREGQGAAGAAAEEEVPPSRRQWHAGEEVGGSGDGGGGRSSTADEVRQRREEQQARRRRRDDEDEEEEERKDEL